MARAKRIARVVDEFAPARNRATAPIRPGRRGDEKQFQSGEVESFSRTLLATSISLLLAYFSLVFPVLAPHHRVYFARSSALARMPPPPPLRSAVPFSSTYCANNSNVATTAILEGHGASGEDRRAGKNKLGEDEREGGRARRGN